MKRSRIRQCRIKNGEMNGFSLLRCSDTLPLALVVPGFLLRSTNYGYLTRRLASCGFVALGVSITEEAQKTLSDDALAEELRLVLKQLPKVALQKYDTNTKPFLVGHSRGAKLCMHLADMTDASCLLDPVDITVRAANNETGKYFTLRWKRGTRFMLLSPIWLCALHAV